MKDEEMAEEYTHNLPFVFETEVVQRIVKMYAKQAFLAGLKAGRPQWHKVADGDLPRQDGNTCFSIYVLASNKKWVYYQFGSGKWFCGNKEVKVIAWCEIPTFDKE